MIGAGSSSIIPLWRLPDHPIERYVTWSRENGEPLDPWIRVHARRGANIAMPIPHSMRITGTVAECEERTGMRSATTGCTRSR